MSKHRRQRRRASGGRVTGGLVYDQELRALIRHLAEESGETAVVRLGMLAAGALEDRAAAGDRWAAHRLTVACAEGLARVAQGVLKEQRIRVPGPDCQPVEVPLCVGLRERTPDGELAPHYTQAALMDLPWEDFAAYVRRRRARWDTEGGVLDAYERILALREEHKDTHTPREACARAGLDWADMGLPALTSAAEG